MIPRLSLKKLIKALRLWSGTERIAEARTQLKDEDAYQELKENIASPLGKIIKSVLRKVRNRKDMSDETLDYFFG